MGINKKKKKRRKKKKRTEGDKPIPPGYEELRKRDPTALVDYEEDFIDERAKNTSNYTATGKATYMSPHDVPVTLWDPSLVRLDSSFIFYGKRRSGKSHLARQLAYVLGGEFDRALVFTGTRHNGFYQRVPEECRPLQLRGKRNGFIPDKAVIQGYDKYRLARFLLMQKNIFEFEEEWEEKGYKLPALVILDDCIGENELQRNSASVVNLYALGRHYHVMPILLTQYPKAVGTILRDNADYAVVFKQESENAIEAITTTYMTELNPATAKEFIRMCTKGVKNGPRQCLIIDLDPFVPAEEKYMTYSCCSEDELPDFVVGSEKFNRDLAFDVGEYLRHKQKSTS